MRLLAIALLVAACGQGEPERSKAPAAPRLDLSPGDGWKGWSAEAPAGAKAVDNALGSVIVEASGFEVVLQQGGRDLAEMKRTHAATFAGGTLTYDVETKDELVYRADVPGKVLHGFDLNRTAGDAVISCWAMVERPEHLAAARAICASTAKR